MNLTNLEKLRTKLGYSQTTLARKIGVSINTYRNWEYGVTKPNEENMKKLKKALKVEV